VLATLAATHDFVQQLLGDLNEGREVHSATLQAAADLLQLFQDPRLAEGLR
jgi:hypothetical protein